ncbi:phage tail protein [Myroides sp. LJL115]
MNYTIKRNNIEVATVSPTGSLNSTIMGEEVVQMNFTLPNYVAFHIGDTVSVYGTTYVLNQEPNVQKVSTINYVYDLAFESFKYDLNKLLVFGLNSNNELTELEHAIMGDPLTILKHLVLNANKDGGTWKVGRAEELEPKNISFSSHNILAALSMCAEEFETEYWIDGDKTIHLTKKQEVSGLSLKYGQSQGLRSINRTTIDSSNVITKLYAQGSSRNIPAQYKYGSSKLKMDVPFLEKNVNKFGVIEYAMTYDDIYPRRKGKVTQVFSNDVLKFADNTMDFDLNGKTTIHGEEQPILLPGTSAKVTFNTGQLAGYTFEIAKAGYNHSKKEFVLLKHKDEKAYELPNNLLKPAVGDEYVITDIVMPELYIKKAELELKEKAIEYLDQNSIPRLQYEVQGDPIYFEEQNIDLQLGNTIKFIDSDFGLDDHIRVVSISKDLQNPFVVEFSIAEEIQQQSIIRDYIDKNKKEQELKDTQRDFNLGIKRNYEFSQEIQENVFDNEGYFDSGKIKPLSIETKMLSVGAREQQFTLEDLTLMVEDNNTTLKNTKGQITHYTIEDKPRTWNIPAASFNGITQGFNFIYIKAQKIGQNASVFVFPTALKVDEDPAFFHFEAGYLSSVTDGYRKLRLSNGFTTINGREITTGRISSQDGNTYFDLDTGEIKGKITFSNNSPALDTIEKAVKDGIGEIEVGGRNLLADMYVSDIKNSSDILTKLYNNNYHVECWAKQFLGINDTNKVFDTKGFYTISYEVELLESIEGMTISNQATGEIGFYNNNNFISIARVPYLDFIKMKKGDRYKVSKTINLTTDLTSYYILIYSAFGQLESQGKRIKTEFHNVKIEKGNVATPWSPAYEDIESKISDQEIYIEYSVDGISSWHSLYRDGDRYMRQKKGSSVWSGAMPFGKNGDQGIPGSKGADGRTSYTHFAWATNANGTVGFSTTVSIGKTYIGTYTDFTQADSTNPSLYKWSQIKGEKGDIGATGPKGVDGANGEPLGDGVMVYKDADFSTSYNGITTYGGSTSATLYRVLRSEDAPTKSAFMLRLVNNGTSEDWRNGGYYQGIQSRPNAVFIHKIIAKFPVGHRISNYENLTGNGRIIKWLTSQEGTGKFETYMYKHTCGVGGTFSSLGHVAWTGPKGTISSPINYDIAYSTVYDMTQVDKLFDFLSTTIDGNTIATGTLRVGQGNVDTAGITGVRDVGQSSNVAFWAGLSFENRKTAPFRVDTSGKLVAMNAEIDGTVNARSGKIASFSISGDFISTEKLMYTNTKSVMKLGGGGIDVRFLVGPKEIGSIDTTGAQKWGEIYNLMEIKSSGMSSQNVGYSSLYLESANGKALSAKGGILLNGGDKDVVLESYNGRGIVIATDLLWAMGKNGANGIGFTGVKNGMRFINGIMVE